MTSKIPGSFKRAVEMMKTCHGGMIIEIISDDLYRAEPNKEFQPDGYLGCDITIKPEWHTGDPLTYFLRGEIVEGIVYVPPGIGMLVAEDITFSWIRPIYEEYLKKNAEEGQPTLNEQESLDNINTNNFQ